MKVAIVGGGASGLFCAYHLIKLGLEVHLFEKESSLGKKLLIAGKSGLNVTSDVSTESFHLNYFDHADLFKDLLDKYSKNDTRQWLKELGFETFVGSSHKVFTEEFKGASLLKSIKDFLTSSDQFYLHLNKELVSFCEDTLRFKDEEEFIFDRAIFALGGNTWPMSGSDGAWSKMFSGQDLKPFLPSNCGFKTRVEVSDRLPIKNIALTFKDKTQRGECMLYPFGIEGGALYALSSFIRDDIMNSGKSYINIDFMPDIELEELQKRLESKDNKSSWSKHIKRKLSLPSEVLDIIKQSLDKESYFSAIALAKQIKAFKLNLSMLEDNSKGISSMGGVSFNAIDKDFSLKENQNIYISGEMLDWEAPTGGFLLQGCFSISWSIVESIKKDMHDQCYSVEH